MSVQYSKPEFLSTPKPRPSVRPLQRPGPRPQQWDAWIGCKQHFLPRRFGYRVNLHTAWTAVALDEQVALPLGADSRELCTLRGVSAVLSRLAREPKGTSATLHISPEASSLLWGEQALSDAKSQQIVERIRAQFFESSVTLRVTPERAAALMPLPSEVEQNKGAIAA